MSSRKEEERNEKIIRGLMKLPPNRKCINCNSLGPQYVCINFWTFVCIACSGIHREFTHRVKSVSMAKFTKQEVEALQKGGNQRAREIFLQNWDLQRSRFPDSSNANRVREFIKCVYVDKKYASRRPSDKPTMDLQSPKNFEEEHRRANSYHSYSQSPPYDHQYEDRLYGKRSGALSRKPGSERGLHEGKISSFICSPGRLAKQTYEDRFANEISGPRISDSSVSSAGETFKYEGQSPRSNSGYAARPTQQQSREVSADDGPCHVPNANSESFVRKTADTSPHPQLVQTSSSGEHTVSDQSPSQDLFHPLFVQQQTRSSASPVDLFAEINKSSSLAGSSLQYSPVCANNASSNLFGPSSAQQPTTSVPSLRLFAETSQPSSVSTWEKKLPVPFPQAVPQAEGWNTFDLPYAEAALETISAPYYVAAPQDAIEKQNLSAFPSRNINLSQSSLQNLASNEPVTLAVKRWDLASDEVKISPSPMCSQEWNAFDNSFASPLSVSYGQDPVHTASMAVDPCMNLKVEEESNRWGLQTSIIDGKTVGTNPSFNSNVMGPSLDPVIPMLRPKDHELKSTNPFDLPYYSDQRNSNEFFNLGALQATLPPVYPASFIGQPWYTQNPVPPYAASIPSGGLAYVAGQPANPQLDMHPQLQRPVAYQGGNPFA